MPLLVALKLRLWCFPYTQCSQNSLWNKFPFHQDLHTFFTHVTQSPEIHHVLSPFVHHQQPCFQAIYTSFRIPFMTTKMPLETLITPPCHAPKVKSSFSSIPEHASHFQVFSQCHQTSASVSSDASSSFLILLWLLIGKAARWILLAIGRERCLPSKTWPADARIPLPTQKYHGNITFGAFSQVKSSSGNSLHWTYNREE